MPPKIKRFYLSETLGHIALDQPVERGTERKGETRYLEDPRVTLRRSELPKFSELHCFDVLMQCGLLHATVRLPCFPKQRSSFWASRSCCRYLSEAAIGACQSASMDGPPVVHSYRGSRFKRSVLWIRGLLRTSGGLLGCSTFNWKWIVHKRSMLVSSLIFLNIIEDWLLLSSPQFLALPRA